MEPVSRVIILSVKYALCCPDGIRYAILVDFSVTYKLVLSAFILVGCFYYRKWLELDLVFIVTGVMLIAEMFNTTIEALCDFVEPKGHPP